MSTRRSCWALLVGLAVTPLGGCLASEPVEIPRYFQPVLADPSPPAPGAARPTLRLGRVTAAAHLGDRMVWRTSDVEMAFDDLNRWAAPPEELTADAIQRSLFLSAAFQTSPHINVPELNVHVTAFEGLGSGPVAVVELRVSTAGEQVAVHVVRAEEPTDGVNGPALARAMGSAMDGAMSQLVAWLQTVLKP